MRSSAMRVVLLAEVDAHRVRAAAQQHCRRRTSVGDLAFRSVSAVVRAGWPVRCYAGVTLAARGVTAALQLSPVRDGSDSSRRLLGAARSHAAWPAMPKEN